MYLLIPCMRFPSWYLFPSSRQKFLTILLIFSPSSICNFHRRQPSALYRLAATSDVFVSQQFFFSIISFFLFPLQFPVFATFFSRSIWYFFLFQFHVCGHFFSRCFFFFVSLYLLFQFFLSYVSCALLYLNFLHIIFQHFLFPSTTKSLLVLRCSQFPFIKLSVTLRQSWQSLNSDPR